MIWCSNLSQEGLELSAATGHSETTARKTWGVSLYVTIAVTLDAAFRSAALLTAEVRQNDRER